MTAMTGNLPNCSHRYAVFVSYLGSKYNGSQRLINRDVTGTRDTIQEALEWSLESSFDVDKCRLTSSSRTDKGVHAIMNCYSLPLMDFSKTTDSVMKLANRRLASDRHEIVIRDLILAPAGFHPRQHTKSREYIYRLASLNNSKLNKTHKPREMLHLLPVTELYKVLPIPCFNRDRALASIDLLRGEHDFASFAEGKVSEPTVRDLEINLSEIDSNKCLMPNFTTYEIHLKSNAFLYHQVRKIVGAILAYATHETIELAVIKSLLDDARYDNWNHSVKMAEPWGLYLHRLNYDKSAFEGAIRTYPGGKEEKVLDFPFLTDESDDDNPAEQKLVASD